MLTTGPRGTKDILPDTVGQWLYIENKIRDLCRLYGYRELRTPIFEHTELFLRGIGETTDVVSKEMYTFEDRGGRSITLRPENTAAVVRSYLEHKMYADNALTKLFYIGSMFRYDRPQAGRYREFHQFGVEALGVQDAAVDAEIERFRLEAAAVAGRTGLVAAVAREQHTDVHFVGFAFEPAEIAVHTIPLAGFPGFGGVEAGLALDDKILIGLWEAFKVSVDVDAAFAAVANEVVLAFGGLAALERTNDAFGNRKRAVGDDALHVDADDAAEAFAFGAGTEWGVEGKEAG